MTQLKSDQLRPFQADEAEVGDACYSTVHRRPVCFIAGPDVNGFVCVEMDKTFSFVRLEQLKYNPICWVEDRPVYKGDSLYYNSQYPSYCGFQQVVDIGHTDKEIFLDGGGWVYTSDLSWDKPKTKKEGWINIYPNHRVHPEIFKTKEAADKGAYSSRIDCIKMEWME